MKVMNPNSIDNRWKRLGPGFRIEEEDDPDGITKYFITPDNFYFFEEKNSLSSEIQYDDYDNEFNGRDIHDVIDNLLDFFQHRKLFRIELDENDWRLIITLT